MDFLKFPWTFWTFYGLLAKVYETFGVICPSIANISMVTEEHFGTSTMTFTIRKQIKLDKSAMSIEVWTN